MTKKPQRRRAPKKTVSIEVRLSEEEKSAFMDACRSGNRPASKVLRRLMGLFVVLQRSKHRIVSMMTRFIFQPLRLALASAGTAAAVAASFILAPTASADMHVAYQVVLQDEGGEIVSMGEMNASQIGVATDNLGEGVRFALASNPCKDSDGASCVPYLTLSMWKPCNGELIARIDQGLEVPASEQTLYEREIGDGRMLVVRLQPGA